MPDRLAPINDTTFAVDPRTDPKDRIRVVIGDDKQAEFYPQAKIERWDNEVNLSLRLVEASRSADVTQNRDGHIVYAHGDLSATFIPLAGVDGDESQPGGLEIDIGLATKPATNQIAFSIQSKGVQFIYQPPLANVLPNGDTWELGGPGNGQNVRPADISGSYAVYAVGQKSNVVGGMRYRAGKVGQLKRPQLEDAVGMKVWADMAIAAADGAGTLTVTIPQKFLDAAVYPIKRAAGLEFGYHTVGGSSYNLISGYPAWTKAQSTPASNGALYSISQYMVITSGSPTLSPSLYSDSSNDPATRLAYLNSGGTALPASPGWCEVLATGTLAYSGITTGVQYWIGSFCSAEFGTHYYDDSGGPITGQYHTAATYAWTDPADDNADETKIVSIYATYTAVEPVCDLTGTVTASITEADIVAGGKTIILTLTDDTYISDSIPSAALSSATAKSTTTAPGRDGNGDLVCTLPATPTTGQFGVLIVYQDAGSCTTPSGWDLVSGAPWGSNTPKLRVFTRVMKTGDTSPTVTISGASSGDSSVANVLLYDGLGSVVTVGAATSSTGSPSTAAEITGAAVGNIILGIIGRGDNENASGQTFGGSSTGVTEAADGGTNAGNDSQISVAQKTLTSTGATGGLSVTTVATDPYIGIILELGVATSSPFAVAKADLVAGLDSAQSEAGGWDAKVKPALLAAPSSIVRTSATVATVTLPAVGDHDITAQETITDTIPATILTGGSAIVATPTFMIDPVAGLIPIPGVPSSIPSYDPLRLVEYH